MEKTETTVLKQISEKAWTNSDTYLAKVFDLPAKKNVNISSWLPKIQST